MAVIDAAEKGGLPILIFSLSVCGIMIMGLIYTVIWFVKDRGKTRQRYEELLEKRLSSGADTMQALKVSLEKVQQEFLRLLNDMLKRNDFEAYRREHNQEHNRLEDQLADISERYIQVSQQINEGLSSMRSLLATLVDVKLEKIEEAKKNSE